LISPLKTSDWPTPSKVSLLVSNLWKIFLEAKNPMAETFREQGEWVDGFLFVGNHLALDFLNTKPILEGTRRELLPNAAALQRWLIASGIVTPRTDKAMLRAWRNAPDSEAFVANLTAFRERLRTAVLRLEDGLLPKAALLSEINALLQAHPQRVSLARRGSRMAVHPVFEPRRPDDVWTPIVDAVANLLSGVDPSRIRKCEAESCVVHFYDTSKKGSRRWCSMNICGNRLKVAAYQRRRRLAGG
jgi:predicted RNA-binding Zn ribbon-like protein